MEELVKKLISKNKTIATMESCTGGRIVDAITCIPGASEILKFSAITYSNEYKIKMGVPEEIINKYTVYSIETANAMAKAISNYTNSDYGVGVTGQLKRVDPNNQVGKEDMVYISIYDKKEDKFINATVQVDKETRNDNKNLILHVVTNLLKNNI